MLRMDGYTNKLTVHTVLIKCYSTNIQKPINFNTLVSCKQKGYSLTYIMTSMKCKQN